MSTQLILGSPGNTFGLRRKVALLCTLIAALVALMIIAPGVAHASVRSVSAGYLHTCALKSDGSMKCWGDDTQKQVSNTPTTNDFTAVSAGGDHTCALKSDRSIECWGLDNDRQVSDTPTTNDFTAVSAGLYHTCGLKSDGSIECWGFDNQREVSDTPTTNDFTAVSAGGFHTCGLKSDGSIKCWGDDHWRQISGMPTTNDFTAVSAGYLHTCGLKSDGSIKCWGLDNDREVSDTPTTNDFTAVSAGRFHTCGLKSDGSIKCWGDDVYKQISDTPTTNDFTAVSAGTYHTCGLKSDGSIRCWGNNSYGQLGSAPATPSPAPTDGKVGTSYFHNFTSSTGTPSGSFSVRAGNLPPGLFLIGKMLSGTPTQVGKYTFTVTASDGIFADASQQFTINIADTTAPTTQIKLGPASPDGQNVWYVSNVLATVSAQDNAGGTGVSEIRCVLDPTSVPTSFADLPSGCNYTGAGANVNGDGQHVLYAASKDKAGNVETPVVSKSFKIDQTPPKVTYDDNGIPVDADFNDTTWRNTSLSRDFTATDTGSGLNESGLNGDGTLSFTLTAQDQSTRDPDGNVVSTKVSRKVTDLAGNSTTRKLSALIDTTNPDISASLDKTPASTGWYNKSTGAPTVSYQCGDALSGLAGTCPASYTFTDGDNQSHSGSVSDKAGNSNSAGVNGVRVDLKSPTVECDPAPTFIVGGAGGNVTASVNDLTSGPVSASLSGKADISSVGNKSVSLTGYDKAGNPTTVSCPYTVKYRFSGFLSPIPQSSYKAGSTIPVKFRLQDSTGTNISDAAAQSLASGCKVKISFSGGTPANNCASYNATTHAFQYDLKTASNLATGNYTITARAYAPDGSVVNTESVQVYIRR